MDKKIINILESIEIALRSATIEEGNYAEILIEEGINNNNIEIE